MFNKYDDKTYSKNNKMFTSAIVSNITDVYVTKIILFMCTGVMM